MGKTYLAAALAIGGLFLGGRAEAAPGTQVAAALTAPAGAIKAGAHLWVADRTYGFCRLDQDLAGTQFLNLFTCVRPQGGIVGQPAYDAAAGLLYLPDSQDKSQGVWRYQFDAANETFNGAAIVAPTAGLGGQRPRCAALGPDGNLYITTAANGNVIRIVNPAGGAQVQTFATTQSGKPALGLQFLDIQLLLAETSAVTMIPDATTCGTKCKNAADIHLGIQSPTALAVDPVARLLYVGSPEGVFRWTRSTGQVDLYSASGSGLGASVPYSDVTGLGVDAAGNLYVADDPAAGLVQGMAALYEVPAGSAISGVGSTPGGSLILPSLNVTPFANPASFEAAQLTTPNGAIWIGNHLWISDGLAGFCRVDPATGLLEPASCVVPGAALPGQAAYDRASGAVYVPTTVPGAGRALALAAGIGQVTYDPATDTVNNVLLPVVTSADLGGDAPTAVALGPDGNLYVGLLRTASILRVTNPLGATHSVQLVGSLTDPTSNAWNLAFAGNDLWIAEKVVVSVIKNATACLGACKAAMLPVLMTTPQAVAWDGANVYIGSLGSVWRFNPVANTFAAVADQGVMNASPVWFSNVSGLAFDANGRLHVAEGPILGGLLPGRALAPPGTVWNLGHAWSVGVAPPRLTAVTPASALAGSTVTVTLTGSNFLAPATVTAGAGIAVSGVAVVNATEITATLSIGAGAPAGTVGLTVTTALGASNALGFTVTAPVAAPAPAPAPAPTAGSATDLQVTGSAQNGGPAVGSPDTFTWQIKNNQGNVTAANVKFTNNLPAALQFASASASLGTCTVPAAGATGGTLTCAAPSLGGGQTMTVTVNVVCAAAGTVANTASVTMDNPDTNLSNNSFSVTVSVK